jgi:succinoglycan biosynthesis transport protein ExoP
MTDELRRKASDELAASQEALRGAAANSNDPLADAAATALSALQRQGAELRVNALVYGDGVDFVNAARAEDADVPGWPLRALAIGFVLGVALAGVVTWMRADRERRITNANAPVAVLDAPLLGVVPRANRGASLLSRFDARPGGGTDLALKTRLPQPQYQLVAAALMRGTLPGVVAVIGPPGSADRPETTLNVAITIAAEGGRVLVVDADPAGSLSTRLQSLERETEGDDGSPEASNPDTIHTIRVREDIEVHLVTPNAEAGIGMPAAREFADRIWTDHEKYEMVMIDAPSIETTPLVAALIRVSTGVLAVVPRGCDESSVADIRRTAEIYSTPLVGFVYSGAHGIG